MWCVRALNDMYKRVLTALILCITFLAAAGNLRPLKVQAASGKVWFKTETAELEVNQIFTVYLMLESDSPMEEFNCYIFYDEAKLSFYKGDYSVQGGDGLLKVSMITTETTLDSKQIMMKFVAKSVGNIVLSVTDAKMNEVGGTAISLLTEDLTLNIGATEDLSNDASLKSLRVSPGSLSPEFSRNVFEYSVSVSAATGSIYVSAIANDEAAKVGIYGHETIYPGDNVVRVIVTAANGTIQEYTLNVHRAGEDEATPTPTASPTPTEEPLPTESGYEWRIESYEEDGKAFIAGNFRYEITEDATGLTIPDGFSKTKLVIAGRSVTVYAPDDQSSEFVLLILRREGQDAAIYRYDRAEGTIQRYVKQDITVHTETGTVNDDLVNKLNEYKADINKLGLILALIAGGWILTFILLFVYIKKSKGMDEL